jgi:beta-glucosidase
MFGVATAAYQVEGGLDRNDWHAFVTSHAIRERVRALTSLAGSPTILQPPGAAVQHDDLAVLEADLDRAQLLGINAYRFSLEWSRLQPNPPSGTVVTDNDFDQKAVTFYRSALEAMRDRDLEPVVTLNHMTLPQWVLDPPRANSILAHVGLPTAVPDATFADSLRGWESSATVDAYARFVAYVVPQYADLVDWWLTINEPVGSMVGVGYIAGIWPPGFSLGGSFPSAPPGGRVRAEHAYFNLIRAHVRAYDIIKELDDVDADGDGQPSRVGFAHAMLYPVRVHGADPLDVNREATRQFSYFYNEHILNSLVGDTAEPAASVVDAAIEADPRWREGVPSNDFFGIPSTSAWRPRLDFIGVNYYRQVHVLWDAIIDFTVPFSGGRFPNDLLSDAADYGLLNDLGWEIYPAGLSAILHDLHDRYRLPILITENGIADSFGGNRAPYIVAHLREVLRAIDEGVEVLGYIHWSLLDNFEWHEHYREAARFGLFRVERNPDGTAPGGGTNARRITEGALALQYVTAQAGLAGAASIFGDISYAGDRLAPPMELQSDVFEGDVSGSPVSLYLVRLAQPLGAEGWIGMLYFEQLARWVRLRAIEWQPAARRLRFQHLETPGPGMAQYEAIESGGSFNGSVTDHAGQRAWQVGRVPPAGLWTSPALLRALHVRRLEGGPGGWQGKFLEYGDGVRWRAIDSLEWDGRALMFRVDGLVNFRGTVIADTMSGTLQYESDGVARTAPWQATKVPTGLPF